MIARTIASSTPNSRAAEAISVWNEVVLRRTLPKSTRGLTPQA